MKTALLFLATLSLLPACGQLESTRVRPSGSTGAPSVQGISSGNGQFQQQCQSRNGVVSSDGSTCLVRAGKTLAAGQTDYVIDPSVTDGNFLVSSGSSNVIITLNGRVVSTANARMLLNAGSGQLAFSVADASSTASAVVYHCYDQGLSAVACEDAQIPR